MVWQQHYERVAPLGQFPELADELAYAVVGVGEGVVVVVGELLERHLEWLMAAQREESREPRRLAVALLEHVVEPVEGRAVGHSPLAVVAVRQREVVLRGDMLESSAHKIAAHVGEVYVATVEEVGLVAGFCQRRRYVRHRPADVRHLHYRHGGQSGIAAERTHRAPVGAETVGEGT